VRPLVIAVPAWTPDYVRVATQYVVPAIGQSLDAARYPYSAVKFLIWTDEPAAFRQVLGRWPAEFRHVALPWGGPRALARARAQGARVPRSDPLPREYWAAFMQAHRDAIAATPAGAICCLFNADIVCSIETFAVVRDALAGDKKVAISVGVRTLLDGNTPPVGADAETLSRYIWSHRHAITEDCIWGSGRSRHPTILFFNHPDGGVSMHCFHLTPMFIVKDRGLVFKGTIDDDLLERYREDELVYLSDRACCFAECSGAWKKHPSGAPLNVNDVLDFGRRRFRPAHIRNFRQRFRVLGAPAANHPAADEILARLS